jgi:hypothetical protein
LVELNLHVILEISQVIFNEIEALFIPLNRYETIDCHPFTYFVVHVSVKFMFSKKATKTDKIFTADLTLTTYMTSNRQ